MIVRLKRIALLATLSFATGCVRHTTVRDFGLPAPVARRADPAPDTSIRAVFRQQTKGAFNPFADDARITSLRNRLKNNPADSDLRLELAAVYESYRLHGEALDEYTAAFDTARSERAVLGIVRCDEALNRRWQAIPLLEQFLKDVPSATAWNALGLLHDASGNLAAGESAFRQAVSANPASDQWHNNLGYNLLLQNKTDVAEAEFRKALELEPKSVTTHNNLGMLLARRGDIEGALMEFQISTDAATAHNNLAVVLMEAGKYEQSREELVKALAMRRNFAPALSNFKLVQERIRQRAELQKAGHLQKSNVRVASTEQEASPLKQ
jgi:tetratricopeptide (TPR) repeat protein